jgi:FkbM family methyltransferase
LKTVFSVFCRHDYATSKDAAILALDFGANIGVAAVYFLTRNPANRVRCYEPDPANLPFLRRNLAPFAARATIVERAVGPTTGTCDLFQSEDGKYTSTIASNHSVAKVTVEVQSFSEALAESAASSLPVVVKLDVEGIETDLVRSVQFERYPQIARIVCESLGCGELVSRRHTRHVRNGYIEDIEFTSSTSVVHARQPRHA